MTPEQAKKLMEVLQWVVDGKEVESSILGTGAWKLLEEGDDVLINRKYRLKPRKPFEFWANVYGDDKDKSIGATYVTKEDAIARTTCIASIYLRTAKFREVIEDDSDG